MHLEPQESMIDGQRRTGPESSAMNGHDARTSNPSVPAPLNPPPSLYEIQDIQRRLEVLSRAVIRVLNSDIAKITFGEILSGLFLNETRNSMRGQLSKYTPYSGHTTYSGYGYSAEEDARRRWVYLETYCTTDRFRPDVVDLLLRSDDYKAYLKVPIGKDIAFGNSLIYTVVKVVRRVAFDLWEIRRRERPNNALDDDFVHPDHRYLSETLHKYPCHDVSHWAESRIFGGVVWKDVNGLWVFSDREGSPRTEWMPNRFQWNQLLLHFQGTNPNFPLPFQPPSSS